MSSRTIEIKMPNPGGFHCSPSGDGEYEQAKDEAIQKGIPDGYELLTPREEVKTEHRVVHEHFALVKVREKEWKGFSRKDRTLWFGVAEEGMEAPWMNSFGACLVNIWDIRRRDDGVIEYGIGNEPRPPDDKMGWVTADAFYGEWPQ